MTPSSLKVIYARNAQRDLLIQADYIEMDSGFAAAKRFVEAVSHTTELLRQSPHMGRIVHIQSAGKSQLRSIPVSKAFGRWIMFYTITRNSLRIERIFHGSRNISDYYP